MSFDTSRYPFNAWDNFMGTVMYQGRVLLDSDWNEWLQELSRRIQATTLDTLGHAAVPSTTPNAFAITITTDSSGNPVVNIGPGRMYVDGLLAENHGLPAPGTGGWVPRANLPGPEPAGLDWDSALAELVGANVVPYTSQPYLPNPATDAIDPAVPFLAYLDVWQREVTPLQFPDLIEKAVGVDTTGRIQTIWQVRLLSLANTTGITCSTSDQDIPGWATLLLPPGTCLTTGVTQSGQSGPCCLAPNTGYTGVENQHYRLEIHQPGTAAVNGTTPAASGAATIKWSRNNASVATGVTGISQGGSLLTVQSTGKDDVLRFNKNSWVEITDDDRELAGLPGSIFQVKDVNDAASTITLYGAADTTIFPVDSNGLTTPSRNTRLILWDQSGIVYQVDGSGNLTTWTDLTAAGATGDIPLPPDGTTLLLEDGVTVVFNTVSGGAACKTGDFWNFAARATDGTVEFLDQAPSRGIHHHYARLAIVTLPSGSGTPVISDCRLPWPPSQPGSGACCDCTVQIESTDITGDTTLQSIVDKYQNLSTSTTFCLDTGTYSLTEPLRLTSAHNNFVFEACQQGNVILTCAQGSEQNFADGLIVLDNCSNISLHGLEFQSPSLTLDTKTFAGLPVGDLGADVAEILASLKISICVRAVSVSQLTVEDCDFQYQTTQEEAAFAVGIFATGQMSNVVVEGNSFANGGNFTAGYLQVPWAEFVAASSPYKSHFQDEEAYKPDEALLEDKVQSLDLNEWAKKTTMSSANGGNGLPATLSNGIFRNNTFASMTNGILIYADTTAVEFSNNTVTVASGGIWVISPMTGGAMLSTAFASSLLGIAIAVGYPLPLNDSSTLVTIAAASRSLRVVASRRSYTDSAGYAWEPDVEASGVAVSGGELSAPVPPPTIDGALPASTDQQLYQSERTGSTFTYTFSGLNNGFYTVTFKMAELDNSAANQRIFDASINSVQVLDELDLFSDAGKDEADDYTFTGVACTNGSITVEFDGETGDASVTGISVVSQWGVDAIAGWNTTTDEQSGSTEAASFALQILLLAQQAQLGIDPGTSELRVDSNNISSSQMLGILVLGNDFVQNGDTSSLFVTGNRVESTFRGKTFSGSFLNQARLAPQDSALLQASVATNTGKSAKTTKSAKATKTSAKKKTTTTNTAASVLTKQTAVTAGEYSAAGNVFATVAIEQRALIGISNVTRCVVNANMAIVATQVTEQKELLFSLVIHDGGYDAPDSTTPPPTLMVCANVLQGRMLISPPRSVYPGFGDGQTPLDSWNLLNTILT